MINYGVIVGRFQVNDLHPGHLELFKQVSEKHDRIICFIGVSRTSSTNRNPLDFETRKKMIQAEYPDFIILPLMDQRYDEEWSDNLDAAIAAVTRFTNHVTLYGGRDSFAPHYFGIHKVHQLDIPNPVSGTDIRSKLSNKVMQSPDFRTGAIYAVANQFPRAHVTVDVAIFHDTGNGIKLLLGMKPGEKSYRFIGGFLNMKEELETAVRRESHEETGLSITSVEYVKSYAVNDWRYSRDTDAKITTALFVGWAMTGNAKPSDDISSTYWFDVDCLPSDDLITPEHVPLFLEIKKYITKKAWHTYAV